MKISITITTLQFLITMLTIHAQTDFKLVYGAKANYTLSVPVNFELQKAIGSNIDRKYVDSEGNTIITLVINLPPGTRDEDVVHLNEIPDHIYESDLEATGLSNVNVVMRGIKFVNGNITAYSYYTSQILFSNGHSYTQYHHSQMQFRSGKYILVQYSCPYYQKDKHMPVIHRVMQSLITH